MIRSFRSFCFSLFKSTSQVRLENIVLRKQLETLTCTSTRPRLRPSDRIFFSVMTHAFTSWKETLLVFRPETVIRWHRQSIRLFWKWKSRKDSPEPRGVQANGKLAKVAVVNGRITSTSETPHRKHLQTYCSPSGPREIYLLAGDNVALFTESVRTSLSSTQELSPIHLKLGTNHPG